MDQKTHIIIQARMGSTRLPGKVMMDLSGKPNLWHVIKRCQASKRASDVIVATTTNSEDDILQTTCEAWGISHHRGSANDVLSRYAETVQRFPSDIIVRITADCPFVDPAIIDRIIDELGDAHYATNIFDREFPHGLDIEVMTRSALEETQRSATTSFHREHVTPYIREHKHDLFSIRRFLMPEEYRFPQFRLTLDTPLDYQLLRTLYERFYREGELISVPELLAWLQEHPEIAGINQHVQQKYDPTTDPRRDGEGSEKEQNDNHPR
ncbi:MAG: glycosyltransferase family protein [bacterium]